MKHLEDSHFEDREIFYSNIPWACSGDGLKGGCGDIIFRVVDEKNKVRGLSCFYGWNPEIKNGERTKIGGSINLGLVGFDARWFLGNTAEIILHYPFVKLKCNSVRTYTPMHNKRAIKLNKAHGFTEEGIMKNIFCYDGKKEDGIILALYEEEAIIRGYA